MENIIEILRQIRDILEDLESRVSGLEKNFLVPKDDKKCGE